MTMAIIILIILLVLAYFYLKCSVLASLSTFIIGILATVVAFSSYEILAELFISRGYGIQWAHCGCYVLAFILSFALLRALRDLLIGAVNIDLGNPLKTSTALICGLLTGIIACGNLLIAIGLSPAQHKMLYSRFSPEKSISLDAQGQPRGQKSFLNTDGFVAGLFSTASRGAFASQQSFAVLHADYLNQIHLNRLHTKEDVLAITSKKSLKVPTGKTKNPVRLWDIDDVGKVTVVRMELVTKTIEKGGAGNPAKIGDITFFPAQIRLICKSGDEAKDSNASKGVGTAHYPIGFIKDGKFVPADLTTLITPEIPKNSPLLIDVVFDIPQGNQAAFLEFKQNAIVELPDAAVPTSQEIETALNAKEEEKTQVGE